MTANLEFVSNKHSIFTSGAVVTISVAISLTAMITYCHLIDCKLFVIASGSMEPALAVGTLVVTKPAARYYPRQVISYYRIEDWESKKDQELTSYNTQDSPITYSIAGNLPDLSKLTSYNKQDLFSKHHSPNKLVVTHRIVSTLLQDGELSYRTQGDANQQPDPEPVPANQVIGKVWLAFPLLGYLLLMPHTQLGFFALIIFPAVLLITSQISKMLLLVMT